MNPSLDPAGTVGGTLNQSKAWILTIACCGTIIAMLFAAHGAEARALMDGDDFTGSDGDDPDATRWTVYSKETDDSCEIQGNTLRCHITNDGNVFVQTKSGVSSNNLTVLLEFKPASVQGRPFDFRLQTKVSGTYSQWFTVFYDSETYGWSIWYMSSGVGTEWNSRTRNLQADTWYTFNLTMKYNKVDVEVKEKSSGTSKLSQTGWSVDAFRGDNKLQFGVYSTITSYSPSSYFDNYALYTNDGPNPPSGLSPANGTYTNSTPQLGWTFSHSGSGEAQAKYHVQIADNVAMTSPDVDTGAVASNRTYYAPQTLSGAKWYWRVRVADSGGLWSSWSAIFHFTVDTEAPGVPGTPTDDGVWTNSSTPTWEWTAPTDATGIAGYYVCVGTASGATDVVRDAWVTTATYTLSGGMSGKAYYCKVKAKDGAGNVGNYSQPSDGITVDLDAPYASRPLDDPRYTNSTDLGWVWSGSDVTSGIEGYYVRVGTTPGGSDVVSGAWTTAQAFSATVTATDTVYYCSVRPRDAAGNLGDWTDASLGAVVDVTPPSNVTIADTGAFCTNGTLVFTWTAATDNLAGVAGYFLDIGTAEGDTDVANAMFVVGTRFEYPYGANGETYYARVRAVDLAGNKGNMSGSTDGITVDVTGPLASRVRDEGEWSTDTTLVFSWDASADPVSDIAGYYLYVGQSPSGADVVAGLLVTGTSYVFTGGVDGRSYYAWVAAKDGAGNIGPTGSASDGITVDATAPAAATPTDGGVWSTSPLLTWEWTASVDITSGIAGYYVRVGTSPGSADVLVDRFVTVTSLSVTDAAEGHTYYCRVQAVDSAGNKGPWSASSDGITVDLTAPVAPVPQDGGAWTNLTSVTFTWAKATDKVSGLDRYEIRIGTGPGGGDAVPEAKVYTETYALATVSDGTAYYAQLRAVDVAGNVGPWSSPSDGITADLSGPTVPTVSDGGKWLAATTGTWTWTEATDATSGLLHYVVEVGTSKGTADVLSGATTTQRSVQAPDLRDGTPYYCRVRARDQAGNLGQWSAWTDGITVDVTPPTAPTVSDAGAYSTKTSIRFAWAGANDATSGVAFYQVTLGTTSDGNDVVDGAQVTGTSYTLTNAQDGVTYYCRVRAVDAASNVGQYSLPTDGITVDSVEPVAYAPIDGGEWHTGGPIAFAWPDAQEQESGIAGYYVSIGTASGATNVVRDVWVTGTSFALQTYVENGTYYCKVRAADVAGNTGPYSPASDGIRVDTVAPSVVYFLEMDEWTNEPMLLFRWIEAEDEVSQVMGYEVSVYYSGPGPGVTSPPGFTSNTECAVQGNDGQSFAVYVRAIDNAGNRGAVLRSDYVFVDYSPPTAPNATDEAEYWRWPTVRFIWSGSADFVPTGPGLSSGVDHYLVDVGTYPGASDIVAGAVVPGLNYTLIDAADGVRLFCRARAVDAVGNVGPYGTPSDGVLVDRTPPQVYPPVPWSSWSTATMAHVAWDPATDMGSGLDNYIVTAIAESGDRLEKVVVVVEQRNVPIEGGKCQWLITDLRGNTTYRIYLAASDHAGNVGYAQGAAPLLTVDMWAGAVRSVVDEGAWSWDPVLGFTWSPVVDTVSGISHYLVYLGTSPDSDDVLAGLAVDGTALTYSAGQDGATYYLRVAAVDRAGNLGRASPPSDGITVDLTPPSSVGVDDSGAWSTQRALTFTWGTPVDAGGVSFTHVAVGTAPGASSVLAVLPGLARSYTLMGALDGTTYHCWVWFEDLAGNVGQPGSASDGITVDLTPPSRVSVGVPGLYVKTGPITFVWDEAVDATSGVAGYDVATDGGAGFGDAVRVTAGASYSLVNAEAGTTYRCRVRAVDRAGNEGPWSDASAGVMVYPGSPNVTLSLDGGAAVTAKRTVAVLVGVSDSVAVDAMRLAEGDSLDAVAWEPYRGSLTLTLVGAEGIHAVRVQVRNAVGAVGGATATIVLDTTAPALSFDVIDGTTTRSKTYNVLGVTEGGAVLTHDGAAVAVGPDGRFSLDVHLVLGANPVRLVATDAAGNAAEASITLYREPVPEKDWTPLAVGFSIGAFIVALVVLLLVFVYLVRRKAVVSWEDK